MCLINQAELERALSEEILKQQECEARFREQRDSLVSTTEELLECKKLFTKECSTSKSLKKELSHCKVSVNWNFEDCF